ncbi:MAG TPA: PD-(D/E)XK nuclease family protein [Gammaproteobacteria bacterium]|nr:PD-(D/E)XK nuclease family protein [Gammaproteobacteria bacterium]
MKEFTTLIPTGENPVTHLAQTLIREHAMRLPDLSHIIILLPNYQPAAPLKLELLHMARERAVPGLLLPRICTLRDFLDQLAPPSDRVIPGEQRLLLLVDALQRHRHLYGTSNPWLLAADLLQLFDELTLYRINLPHTVPQFADFLTRCYRTKLEHPELLREAQIVHTLWQAWHEQLRAEGWTDATSYYLQQLGQSLQRLPKNAHFYVTGFSRFIPAETEWLRMLAKQRTLRLMLQGDADESGLQPRLGFTRNHNRTAFSDFLQAALDTAAAPLLQRARDFVSRHASSPALERIRIMPADSFEQEIQLVTLEVQRALQRGDRYIGVITEDRKFARRLRAYLERSRIDLHDATGWALSTTRAVALLENWLQCVENDFPHHAFLDLLKSAAPPGDEEYLKLIYRFETDIILHENIGSGIKRYRKALLSRARRLPWWNSAVQQQLIELLELHERAAVPLQKLQRKVWPADSYARELLDSLQRLQLHHLLDGDEAGRMALSLLDRIQRGASAIGADIGWQDFRTWLGYALETQYFSPATRGGSRVQLLTLQQSPLQGFDTLIIASADENRIPGFADALPFFNDAVRGALSLPDWEARLRERQYHFRCLLENNPRIFVSWQRDAAGEPVALSSWFEIINHFHETAYNRRLLAMPDQDSRQTDATVCGDIALPEIPQRPQPAVAASAVPADITASSHQRLVDCPYQFYVYDVLQLKATDEIRQALQKSDYGERVHRCLQAFHTGIQGLPGPFGQPVTQQNRAQALDLLQQIARAVFTDDIEDNFLHRGWLQRWLGRLPDYIDWQLEHNADWAVENAEQQYQVALDSHLNLRGRIDRIERGSGGVALIDYKTGRTPSLDEVLSGEDVQLPSYSLFREDVVRVQYLGLDRKKIEDKTVVEGEQLQELRLQVRARLLEAMQRIRSGAPLPALGQPPVCDYCDASGLCRRKIWQRQQQEQSEK